MAAPRFKLLPLVIAALLSSRAGAVGLGSIELHSNLGKPLEAMIPLSHLDNLSSDQLRVSLGSQDEYTALGVEFTYQHTLIKLEPVVRDGHGYIRVVTRDAVAEPYLNFVLSLRWPQGQVVREYTVLLDLPNTDTAGRVAATTLGQPAAVLASTAEQTNLSVPVVPAREAWDREAPTTAAPNGRYRVQRGDSLWKLAERWRPAGVGVAQMMGAIHSANGQAFVGGDQARLKEAADLRMPSAEQIAAASADAMPAPVRANTVADTPTPAPEPMPAVANSAVAAPRDEELAAENAALKSQVGELSTNVAALTDSLSASQDRLHDMEVKLSTLVDQLERQRVATQALATAAGVAPPTSEALVNQASAGDLLSPAPARTPWWVHLSYWSAIGALGAWLVATQWRPRRRLVLAAAPKIDDEIEQSLVAQRVPVGTDWNSPAEQENYWHHGGDINDLPLDLVTPEVPAATLTKKSATAPANLPDRPSFADTTVIRTAEDAVDPAISAGVFAAFGRFEEAEQVLGEALQRAPGRVDLQLQLLDVYKHQNNREAFLALADAVAREHADDDDAVRELISMRSSYLG